MTKPSTIKFKYIFDDNYNPKYVNGAFGGITPKGEIAVNFFLERQGLPVSQTYEVSNEGKLGPEIEKEPDDLQASMIRFVDTGVVLSLNSAKDIMNWLSEKVKILEEIQNENTETH